MMLLNFKRKIKRIVIFIIILIIILITLIVGKSYSKYINEIYGKGIIKVADWSFLVNGESSKITNINLANTYNKEILKENTIAPGTEGSFDIVVDATGSEVRIDYIIMFENETNKPLNLKFLYGETMVNSIKELEPLLKGQILAQDNEKVRTMKIKWIWKYETGEDAEQIEKNNKADTQDGKLLENYKFDVVIQGNQIAPQV